MVRRSVAITYCRTVVGSWTTNRLDVPRRTYSESSWADRSATGFAAVRQTVGPTEGELLTAREADLSAAAK